MVAMILCSGFDLHGLSDFGITHCPRRMQRADHLMAGESLVDTYPLSREVLGLRCSLIDGVEANLSLVIFCCNVLWKSLPKAHGGEACVAG